MKKFFSEFKAFINRGNILELAIGIIIGGAFTAVVNSLTSSFINPLLNVIMTPEHNPGNLGSTGTAWTFGGAVSAFLTVVVNFVITAFVLFCLLRGINKLVSMTKKPPEPKPPETKVCPYCKSEVPVAATRCKYCTSELPAAEPDKAP